MFRRIREVVRALQGTLSRIADALQAISVSIDEREVAGPYEGDQELRTRLDALERSRATWEAEAEGLIIKAESRFKAARAAEERARHLLKDRDAEEDEDGWAEDEDAPRGRAEGVPAMHQALEVDAAQAAPNGRPLSKRERARQLKYMTR